jgi:isochorismate hydrolase
VEIYAKYDLPIFFTRHINDHLNAQMMATWWRELITSDHPLAWIIPGIDVSKGSVIDKAQYDAFHGTSLFDLLIENDVTQIVITGVMTHLCCETTARSGFMNGFEVFFVMDGTATYNFAYHEASMLNLEHGFAHMVFIDEILKNIQRKLDE